MHQAGLDMVRLEHPHLTIPQEVVVVDMGEAPKEIAMEVVVHHLPERVTMLAMYQINTL